MQDGSNQRVWHVPDNVFVYIIRLLRPNEDDIAQVNLTPCKWLRQLSCSNCMADSLVIPRCISSAWAGPIGPKAMLLQLLLALVPVILSQKTGNCLICTVQLSTSRSQDNSHLHQAASASLGAIQREPANRHILGTKHSMHHPAVVA